MLQILAINIVRCFVTALIAPVNEIIQPTSVAIVTIISKENIFNLTLHNYCWCNITPRST